MYRFPLFLFISSLKLFAEDNTSLIIPYNIISIALLLIIIFLIFRIIKLNKQVDLSQNEFETIFKYAGSGLAKVSLDGKILDVNNKFCEILKYESSELLNLNFQEITYAQDLEKDLNNVKKMLNKNIDFFTIKKRYVCKDKSIVWANLIVTMILKNDGEPKYFISIINDITDYIEKEEKLKTQNTKLVTLKSQLDNAVEIATLGIWEWDTIEDIWTCSDIAYDIYGVKRNTSLTLELVESLLVHEDIALHRKKVSECLEYKKPFTFEYKIKKNSEIRAILVTCKPITKDTKVVKVVGVVQDITDIREKEKELIYAQKISRIGHYDFNIENNYFTSSIVLDDIWGIPKNYTKTFETWLELVIEEEREEMKDYFLSLIKNKTYFDKEYRIINQKTKEIKWVHGLGVIIFDEKNTPLRMFGTIQDITQRKKNQAYMAQALNVFEKTHSGIMITDTNNVIINVNPAFSNITGYSIDEVLGKNPSILKSDKHDESFFEKMWEDITTKGNWNGEITNKRKNDELYQLSLTINTIKNNNKIDNYIGIFSDISMLKLQESMLIQQSRTSAIGEMIGNIAHQWRQPLSVISTASTGLKLQLEMNDKFEKKNLYYSLDKINEQTQYLSKTIEDFRNFFMGGLFDTVEFDLKEVFEIVRDLTKDAFSNNFIEVKQELENDIYIIGNKNLLIQALINIYNNALDALKSEDLKDEPKLLYVSLKQENSKIILCIKDNGGGIKDENIEKVFDPYFTTKHKSQGTGIGLHMTHQIIVKQLEGKIAAKNCEINYKGKKYIGAEFIINL